MRALWLVVLCGGIVMSVSVGFRQALGLFLTPITLELGIGRESFALGMGLMNLMWGLGAPFAGAVADRWGAGRVVALGGIAYAAGLWLMTLGGDGAQLVLGGTLIGLGLSGSGFTVILGVVGRTAPEHARSRALGLVAMAGSIGQFLALPYTQLLISGWGWSFALVILAATALAILPLSIGVAGRPGSSTGDGVGEESMGAAFAAACRDGRFWLLNAGFFVCGFHLAFVAVHLPAYLADGGFAPWLAAATLTVIGLSNILGSYICGYLGGRFPKNSVLSWLYLGRTAIFVVFLLAPLSEVSVLLFGAAMGFLWLGTVPLTSGLVGAIWGTRYMSMLFGIVFLGHQVGGFLGAWLAGVLYDTVGSYDLIWWACAVLGVVSAVLHWPVTDRSPDAAAVVA